VSDTVSGSTGTIGEAEDSKIYSWYVVMVLMLCYALSFIDRQVLSLLVEPIKQDLVLTDTQFSLLQGLAFALFYTFVGLFMGKLADTKNRRWIIVIGITAWSLMTACCGLARNFFQLFMARVGIAIGEATLSPSAYSLIGDYFKKENLGRAMSAYTVGVYLGSGLAFLVGGALIASIPEVTTLPVLGEVKAWQLVFLIIGFAGLPFALLVLTIREPQRGRYADAEAVAASTKQENTIFDSLRFFVTEWRFYGCHFFGFSMLTTIGYGFHSWVPAYFIRVHEWEASEIGVVYGSINVAAAPLGVLAGGWFGDYLARRGRTDAFLIAPVFGAVLLWIPASLATSSFIRDPIIALYLLAVLHFFASFHGGMAVAALHSVTPLQMRAQATAVYLFVINLVGLGLGPLIVALMTDYVFRSEQAVGRSLAVVGFIATPLAILLLTYGRRRYSAMVIQS
jgi:MFS family permease